MSHCKIIYLSDMQAKTTEAADYIGLSEIPHEIEYVDLTEFTDISEYEKKFDLVIFNCREIPAALSQFLEHCTLPVILMLERNMASQVLPMIHNTTADLLIKAGDNSHLAVLPLAIDKLMSAWQRQKTTSSHLQELEKMVRERTTKLEEEVSRHKSTLVQLMKSNEKYRNLVETSYDRVWEIDSRYGYTYNSQQVEPILGYGMDEVVGRTPMSFMVDEDADRFARMLEEQKAFVLCENRFIHKKGHIAILESNGIPKFNADGSFKGYRGIDRDITRRRRAEERLIQTYQIQKSICWLLMWNCRTKTAWPLPGNSRRNFPILGCCICPDMWILKRYIRILSEKTSTSCPNRSHRPILSRQSGCSLKWKNKSAPGIGSFENRRQSPYDRK